MSFLDTNAVHRMVRAGADSVCSWIGKTVLVHGHIIWLTIILLRHSGLT